MSNPRAVFDYRDESQADRLARKSKDSPFMIIDKEKGSSQTSGKIKKVNDVFYVKLNDCGWNRSIYERYYSICERYNSFVLLIPDGWPDVCDDPKKPHDKLNLIIYLIIIAIVFFASGILGLIGVCGFGAYKYKTKGKMSTSVFLMQLRVAAQGTVVSALTIGLVYKLVNEHLLKSDKKKE